MKTILFFIMLSFKSFSIGQQNHNADVLRHQYITLKQEGWMFLSMGALDHTVGMIPYYYGDMNNPKVYGGFIFCQTVSVGLDILAFRKLYKARQIKIKLQSVPKF